MTRRPRLVYSGPGKTAAAVIDEQAMELAVMRDETLASARRMRMVLIRPIWSSDAFAPVAKPLLEEIDRIERRLAEPERAA